MSKFKLTITANKERAIKVFDRLLEEYPDAECSLDHTNPLELTVATILSAQCTDARVNMVTPALFRTFKTPMDYAEKPLNELKDEPLIVSVGADGSFYLNVGEDAAAAMPSAELQRRVAAVLRRRPNTPILVWGDLNVRYGNVVDLMAQLQTAGAPSVGLVTENPTPTEL